MNKNRVVDFCDKTILFSLYAIAYFLPISKALIEFFIYLAIILFLVKKILLRENLNKSLLNSTVLVYLAVCFASIFLSTNPKISYHSFLGKALQNITLFFIFAETLNTERRIKKFVFILMLSSALIGIDGIYQHFTHKDFIRNRKDFMIPRIYATFPSPSDFGCYLITIIPFTLVNFFSKHRYKIFNLLSMGLFILLFSCLTLTVSRGAWFAFISSILFMSIWIRFLALFFLILGITIILIHPFLNPYIQERLSNFFVFTDNSSSDRKFMWEAGWKMFLSRPWIGVGLGTFMFNFRKFVSPAFTYIAYAHNCYLQMVAEIGIIGLASFLLILVLFFYRGISILNHAKAKTFPWYILLASLASLLGYCVQISVDTMFYSLDLGVLFWLILGLGSAAMQVAKLTE